MGVVLVLLWVTSRRRRQDRRRSLLLSSMTSFVIRMRSWERGALWGLVLLALLKGCQLDGKVRAVREDLAAKGTIWATTVAAIAMHALQQAEPPPPLPEHQKWTVKRDWFFQKSPHTPSK